MCVKSEIVMCVCVRCVNTLVRVCRKITRTCIGAGQYQPGMFSSRVLEFSRTLSNPFSQKIELNNPDINNNNHHTSNTHPNDGVTHHEADQSTEVISLCVYVYVCVRVCAYECVCVRARASMAPRACLHVCMRVFVCVRVYLYTCVCACTCKHGTKSMPACVCMRVRVCARVRVRAQTHTRAS